MPRSVIEDMGFPTENAFKCGPKFGTENGVNDGVEGGVEKAQPLEEADHVVIEVPVLKNGHKQGQNEEG